MSNLKKISLLLVLCFNFHSILSFPLVAAVSSESGPSAYFLAWTSKSQGNINFYRDIPMIDSQEWAGLPHDVKELLKKPRPELLPIIVKSVIDQGRIITRVKRFHLSGRSKKARVKKPFSHTIAYIDPHFFSDSSDQYKEYLELFPADLWDEKKSGGKQYISKYLYGKPFGSFPKTIDYSHPVYITTKEQGTPYLVYRREIMNLDELLKQVPSLPKNSAELKAQIDHNDNFTLLSRETLRSLRISKGRLHIKSLASPLVEYCSQMSLLSDDGLFPLIGRHSQSSQTVMIKELRKLSDFSRQDMKTYWRDSRGLNSIGTARKCYTLGRAISEHFVWDLRLSASRYDSPSPHDIVTSPSDLKKLLRKSLTAQGRSISYMDEISSRSFQIIFRSGDFACNHFPPVVAVMFIRYLQGKRLLPVGTGSIHWYDPSAGWGDRLVAALAVEDVGVYRCTDPNKSLHSRYKKIAAFFKSNRFSSGYRMSKKSIVTIDEGSEKITGEDIDFLPNFVFTSPPYFNTEKYSSHEGQSYLKYSTYKVWLESFLFETFKRSYELSDSHAVIAFCLPVKIVRARFTVDVCADLEKMVLSEYGFNCKKIMELPFGRREKVIIFQKNESASCGKKRKDPMTRAESCHDELETESEDEDLCALVAKRFRKDEELEVKETSMEPTDGGLHTVLASGEGLKTLTHSVALDLGIEAIPEGRE